MPITMNHSAPFGAYGGAMANAAKQTQYLDLLNPLIQQYMGQEFQSGESGRERTWKTGESALDRALQEALQASQQKWQTGEREGSQTWQGTESAAERALREKLQKEQLAKQYPFSGMSSVYKSPSSGGGWFAQQSGAAHQQHFGY